MTGAALSATRRRGYRDSDFIAWIQFTKSAGAGIAVHVTGMLHNDLEHRNYHKVTVTLGKIPVTLAVLGKIPWQAGMSSLLSNVRGYVRLEARSPVKA